MSWALGDHNVLERIAVALERIATAYAFDVTPMAARQEMEDAEDRWMKENDPQGDEPEDELSDIERAEKIQNKLDIDAQLKADRGLEVEDRGEVDPVHSSRFYEAPQQSSGLDQQHPPWPTGVNHCKRCGAIQINIAYEARLHTWKMTCTACDFKWERADEA